MLNDQTKPVSVVNKLYKIQLKIALQEILLIVEDRIESI